MVHAAKYQVTFNPIAVPDKLTGIAVLEVGTEAWAKYADGWRF
jgi:hypothetical protein